jgi:hypothetical protein
MKRTGLLLLALLWVLPLFAQSNDFIDNVIGGQAITGAQAAYIILVASENLSDDADDSRAFEMVEQLGWVPPGLTATSTINYGEFSYILMHAFGVKGGFMYQLFPTPRYAYRELRFQVVLQGATDPLMPVSGAGAMRMIGRIFDVKGVEK